MKRTRQHADGLGSAFFTVIVIALAIFTLSPWLRVLFEIWVTN